MVEKYLVVLVVITTLILCNNNVCATDVIVGDDAAWKVPDSPTFYSSWASKHTFIVGDTLVFNFMNGSHTVALVNKDAYETCNTSNVISVKTQSPVRVPLQKIGQLHFMCTIDGHCSSGLKLAINITNESPMSSSPPAPSSAPSASNHLTPFATLIASSSLAFFLLLVGFYC
ncbi:umecyanin-like [Chenopodium quinoa]|uniref:umecyanin-like n=1 Tax=Chenopodium quinoa TaxID=63459 RepID=UPI000B774FA4|nr:umecyanin-like [Chenopodium quinoa]